MEFGLQFFPAVGPDQVSAERYFRDALNLIERAERLGYTNVRAVEHHFHRYGGYSPNPLVFLAAAAARTTKMRLITGAVLPVFNNPLKLAGEIGMVDAISGGRLEVGLARAFVPQEFVRFGVSLDESRARFEEGLAVTTRLLQQEGVAYSGRFHSFPATTSLPRPTQTGGPPVWVAAVATEESFVRAGERGHWLMTNPLGGSRIRRLIETYREAWTAAGHPGRGRVMIAFFMVCDPDHERAVAVARGPIDRWLAALADATSDWAGTRSADYPGYEEMVSRIGRATFETNVEEGAAWVGTPKEIRAQIDASREALGEFDIASLQVSITDMSLESAQRSMEAFASDVMPAFSEPQRVGAAR